MYCSECGTKNEKDAKFCEKCGNKLISNNEPQKKVKKKSSKKPILIILLVIIVIALFIVFYLLINKNSPKAITKEYLDAIEDKDYDKLYKIGNYNSEFLAEDLFKKSMKEMLEEIDIDDYKIHNVTYSNNKKNASVDVTIKDDNDKTRNIKVNLIKENNKYKLDSKGTLPKTIKNYKLEGPKNSTYKYNNKSLDKKYLNNKSTNTTYTLPEVFDVETPVEIKLSDGKTIHKTTTKGEDTYKVEITEEDFSKKDMEKIGKDIQTTVNRIITGAVNNTPFNKVNSNFYYASGKEEDVEKAYNKLIEEFQTIRNEFSSLNIDFKFNYKTPDITSLKVLDDSSYQVNGTIPFEITLTYTEDGESKEETETDDVDMNNWNIYYQNGTYKIVNLSAIDTSN